MMLSKKYFVKIILCLWIVAGCWSMSVISVHAKEHGLEKFGFDIATEDGSYTYTVNWWQQMFPNEMEYYITIPYSAKNRDVNANFVSDDEVYFNGARIENGQLLSNLVPYNTIQCSGKEYRLHVMYGSDIPTMHITTDSGSIKNVCENKDHKESAYARIIENGNVTYEGKLEYIKGRGNSTWDSSKKPFNIKFQEKINLFEMGAAKKWCLLANYKDATRIKNKIGYDLADTVGFSFSPESLFVDLYIDNEYIGHYLVSEKIEVKKGRVNIVDLEELNEKANPDIVPEELKLGGIRGEESALECGSGKWVEIPNNPETITGGYVLEFELPARYDSEVSGFVSDYGQPIIINSPEYASKEQVDYISNYYQEFENAVMSGDGYNEMGKHYSDYIDVESVAKMYVFQEYIKNDDGASTSLFFYKNSGGKLVAGPVWDVDLAFGVSIQKDDIDLSDPNGKWMTESHLQYQLEDKYTIFSLLCRHNDFREEAQKQWEEYFQPNIDGLIAEIESLSNGNMVSIVLDKLKWSLENVDFGETISSFEDSTYLLSKFVAQRSKFMSELFSDEVCYIEYNSNGGSGEMYDLQNYSKGTMLQLQGNVYVNDERRFLGWNTKASGWGESYKDGEKIILKSDLTLYAQWEKVTFPEKLEGFLLGIMGN